MNRADDAPHLAAALLLAASAAVGCVRRHRSGR